MYLNKDNSKIYYEVRGEGDALILIHGVITDSVLFECAAQFLSSFFRVVTFDRSGNSRSRAVCDDPDHAPCSIREQAEDVRDLMDELGISDAYMVGVSAGGVVGEHFMEMYPDRVRHLILYEPAMLADMLENDGEFREWTDGTNALVSAGKISNALLRFAQHIGPADKRSPARPPEVSERELRNIMYAFNSEIPAFYAYKPDMDKMQANADRITVAAGEKSGDTAYFREAERLARKLGRKALYYPGGHNLPYDLPEEFAVCVLGTLKLRA